VSYYLEIGTGHRILTYSYAGIFGAGTAQCVEAATATLLSPAPTVGTTSFTLTTQSQVAFISYAPTIFAQPEGSFSGGQLNLSWDTGRFPSYGYQVTANGQVQATNVVNDASYLNPIATSAAAIPVIYDGLQCPFSAALPDLFYPSPCNAGSASVAVP
jgi:hypothetical protein